MSAVVPTDSFRSATQIIACYRLYGNGCISKRNHVGFLLLGYNEIVCSWAFKIKWVGRKAEKYVGAQLAQFDALVVGGAPQAPHILHRILRQIRGLPGAPFVLAQTSEMAWADLVPGLFAEEMP